MILTAAILKLQFLEMTYCKWDGGKRNEMGGGGGGGLETERERDVRDQEVGEEWNGV